MKNIKAPKLVTIAMLSMITVVFWVGFEIFRAFTVKPEPPVDAKIILAIDPTLDTATLSKVKNKIFLENSQISDVVLTPAPTTAPEATLAPTIEPIPTATEAATPIASGSATPTTP